MSIPIKPNHIPLSRRAARPYLLKKLNKSPLIRSFVAST